MLRFVSVVGADTTVLPHAIEHYASLGVERFHIIRHVDRADDAGLARSVTVMQAAGLEFAAVHAGPWDMDLNARLIGEAMRQHPEDWWLVADLDEFHVFDRPVADLIAYCERGGYDYVEGCFLDRVAEGGRLCDPEPGMSLWLRYPLAGHLTFRLMRGRPTKVVLARGHVEIDIGQHMAWTGRPAPREAVFAQVHHFKWTASVADRLARRVHEYAGGTWQVLFPAVIDESRAMLAHLARHGGRIDVAEPEFGFVRCTSRFSDYPCWRDVLPALTPYLVRDERKRRERQQAAQAW